MSATKYTYSIAGDFPGGAVNTTKLDAEIRASSITIALDRVDASGDVIDIWFKDALSSGEETILDGDATGPAGGLIAAHDNTPSMSYLATQIADSNGAIVDIGSDDDHRLNVVPYLPIGDKLYLHTVNWCDKRTWYETAVKVEAETLTDSGNGTTFESAHAWWIDMNHGRMTDEDYLIEQAGPIDPQNHRKWIPIVTINGAEATESSWGETDEDYVVEHATGKVTFHESQSGKEIKATYWYAVSGTYTLAPISGKRLELIHVELQFSKDMVLRDTMTFQAYGYAGVFAPQLVDNVNVFPTTKIPIGRATKYKRAFDFINEANGIYPITPAWGGTSRGITTDILTFPWNYMARLDLYSSYGMEIRISMDTNTPHDGELGTVTFYCISVDE